MAWVIVIVDVTRPALTIRYSCLFQKPWCANSPSPKAALPVDTDFGHRTNQGSFNACSS